MVLNIMCWSYNLIVLMLDHVGSYMMYNNHMDFVSWLKTRHNEILIILTRWAMKDDSRFNKQTYQGNSMYDNIKQAIDSILRCVRGNWLSNFRIPKFNLSWRYPPIHVRSWCIQENQLISLFIFLISK